MKSIKPGRGPSAMGAMGSIVAAVFGLIWTGAAVSMGAPIFFPLFGVVFVIMGIVQAVYNFKNATSENRYSEFDIVDGIIRPGWRIVGEYPMLHTTICGIIIRCII